MQVIPGVWAIMILFISWTFTFNSSAIFFKREREREGRRERERKREPIQRKAPGMATLQLHANSHLLVKSIYKLNIQAELTVFLENPFYGISLDSSNAVTNHTLVVSTLLSLYSFTSCFLCSVGQCAFYLTLLGV